MGKSPGRWIKTALFGKKSSKHNVSKKAEKVPNAREVLVPARAPETDLSLGSLVACQPNIGGYGGNEREKELENNDAPNLPLNWEVTSENDRDMAIQTGTTKGESYDSQKIMEEMAATKAQAVFRGYLARRAFRALKGIIRLQALIRGHLARRQAVVTLYSMLGIVKLQAIVRGRKVRQSKLGLEVRKIVITEKTQKKLVDPVGIRLSKHMAKLSTDVFVQKLLASLPNVMPLHLIYDPTEPNSHTLWMGRWSASFFWRPRPQPKELVKTQKNRQTLEAKTRKSKRGIQRAAATNTDDSLTTLSTSNFERPKRSPKKVLSTSVDPLQECPPNEIEKVKRSLRKVHNPVLENTVCYEVEDEKPRESLEKPSMINSGDAILERCKSSSGDSKEKEAVLTFPDLLVAENTPEPIKRTAAVDLSFDNKSAEDETKLSVENSMNVETTLLSNGTYKSLNLKDDSSNGNAKISRKTSLKQENAENGLQSTPTLTLPSYMAATESAKAKLRTQSSPRFGQDGSEMSNLSRRHSLPSSMNSKGHSPSPRTQKGNISGGKGSNKADKREAPAKAEWRR